MIDKLAKHPSIALLCVALVNLPGCFIPSRYLMRKNLFIQDLPIETPHHHGKEQPLTVTIWVHGTRFFSRSLHHDLFDSKPGIAQAYAIDPKYNIHTIAHTLFASDPLRFNKEHFYVFSWSGKLCFDEREQAAQALTDEIQRLLAMYPEPPRLRIIGHSHGGNVTLNLALQECTFAIDELILLACPVQGKTKHLIESPMFKKVYALYSALDIIQILDPQGMYKHNHKACSLFSKRQFLHQPNLAQMKVKINRRAITHCEFAKPAFLKLLPHILDEIDHWHQEITYTQDPNSISKLLCVYTDRTDRPLQG